MDWRPFRNVLEKVTHGVFREPARVYPTTGAVFLIEGILRESGGTRGKYLESITPEFGVHDFNPVFEVRVNAPTGPHSLSQFPIRNNDYGSLELLANALPIPRKYQIIHVNENSSLLTLVLGNFRP